MLIYRYYVLMIFILTILSNKNEYKKPSLSSQNKVLIFKIESSCGLNDKIIELCSSG